MMGLFALFVGLVCLSSISTTEELHLTTDDEGYLTVIQGFATQLQCVLNTCSSNVVWLKDDNLLFNGTKFSGGPNLDEKAYKLEHRIEVNLTEGCTGSCDSGNPCSDGFSCVDNQCCACRQEEFTLVLKNLTFEDSGRYKCQIANKSEQLEFQVEVLESGLHGGFHENISYDHSECCQKKGISPLCRSMCKPSDMDEHHFDPTSCKTDDYKNFLSCATDNGTRSHVHCCKTQLVPSFCFDFCSGNFQMLRRSHRLCLYYLPEIFECYNRAYLPFPDAPEDVQVNAVEHDKLSVCWKPPPTHPSNQKYPVTGYTVSYKEVPNFPLLGGDLALLTGDYSEDVNPMGDNEYTDEETSTPDDTMTRRKREITQDTDLFDSLPAEYNLDEIKELSEKVSMRRKRGAIVVMTSDPETNTTSVREFNFQHVNTTDTCLVLKDLRSSTRYIVIVTARNDYGMSIPSVRSLASSNIQTNLNNETTPDVMQCCKDNRVSDQCASKMCRIDQPMTSMETVTISTTCRDEWPKVSPCIADERNHTDCCVRKGVMKDCLSICAGSTKTLGVHSILCLNIDLQAIYQCVREGYETHPSAPVNVTVHDITESSAVIEWAEPNVNAHLVENFTLFIRRNEHDAPIRTVVNAVSPHYELGLLPDSDYSIQVKSHSVKGESLPSTAILFSTKTIKFFICPIGEPLLLSEGRPFLCDKQNSCPVGYICTEGGIESYCCQTETSHSDTEFKECCSSLSVSSDCLSSCSYNATLPKTCIGDLNKWIRCGSEGQDHSRCCQQNGVEKDCMAACRHPFEVPDRCFSSVSVLQSCFAGHPWGVLRAVQNVEITMIQSNAATVSWEDNESSLVDTFIVNVFKGDELIETKNTTADIMSIEKLSPSTKYSVQVIAENSNGRGPPSWKTNFTTLPENDSDLLRPRQPEGVHIEWNQGTRVNVTWNPVTKRRNGENVENNIEYTLYYVNSEESSQWTQIKSNHTWALMTDLKRDVLYSAYVSASEGDKPSRTSSVITLIAQPDSYGLPEPTMTFIPDREDGVYSAAEMIKINCSIEISKKEEQKHLNMDLSTAENVHVFNDHGATWVSTEVTADSTLDTASCTVSDTDGRENVAMKHILVKFGPTAKMERQKIRAFDDQSAEISCIVNGFPMPDIRFEKDGKPVHRGSKIVVKMIKLNTYKAILTVRNATGQAGMYRCIAEKNGNKSESDRAELIISKEKLPINPRLILSCCEDEHIEGECLQACTIGKTPKLTNCTQYAKSLLKCAEDVKDHSDCCIKKGVHTKCLPLCSGDTHSSFDCSTYAVSIMSCFVRGHESAPQAVTNINYKVLGKGKVQIDWSDSVAEDSYQYYAVYYKRKNDDSDYKIKKTAFRTTELELEDANDYEVGVLAANSFGHSPMVFLDVDSHAVSETKKVAKEESSSFFFIVVLLLITGVIIVGIIFIGRRRELPAPLGKLVGRKNDSANQPTVAFENPAFVSGNEVEIRGLGTSHTQSDWQQQDLQSTDSNNEYNRNGMRYSKLDSTA